MFHFPNGPELIFIVALALIVFGPKKLPEIGKSIGQGLRELRKASREITGVFDFREEFSLDDDTSFSSASSHTSARAPDDPPESDMHTDMPKENENDADHSEHHAVPGLADHHPGDSGTLRSEEASGDRKVDG